MDIQDILAKIREGVPEANAEIPEPNGDPFVVVEPEAIVRTSRFLRDDEALRFDYLTCLSGLDEGEKLTVVYVLRSLSHGHGLIVRTSMPRENPEIDTVSPVWSGAGWFEREAFDLFGITFRGHADLRRIMLPEDWEGHPLRKDYEDPLEYRGIDNTRDYGI